MSEVSPLTALAQTIHYCRFCPLGKLRTHAVPGEGAEDAEILFIGEAPGYHEDQRGRPFVGASGRLLEKLLARIQLTREQVYITNIIKCRPNNNRDPLPNEIAACTPYLRQQISLLSPLLIVTLGRYSMHHFFPPHTSITRVHGQPLEQDDYVVLPMFHPAAALRNPQWMQAMEADFDKIPQILQPLRQKRAQQNQAGPDDVEQLSLF